MKVTVFFLMMAIGTISSEEFEAYYPHVKCVMPQTAKDYCEDVKFKFIYTDGCDWITCRPTSGKTFSIKSLKCSKKEADSDENKANCVKVKEQLTKLMERAKKDRGLTT